MGLKGLIGHFWVALSKAKLSAKPLNKNDFLLDHANETDFHKKGFSVSLVLKVKVFGTWKWPIDTVVQSHD